MRSKCITNWKGNDDDDDDDDYRIRCCVRLTLKVMLSKGRVHPWMHVNVFGRLSVKVYVRAQPCDATWAGRSRSLSAKAFHLMYFLNLSLLRNLQITPKLLNLLAKKK